MCFTSFLLTQITASLLSLQPPELTGLIRQYDKDSGAIRAEFNLRAPKQTEDLVQSLRRMQQQLALASKISEAELIQEYLQRYKPQKTGSFGSKGDEMLPASALRLVLEHDNGFDAAHGDTIKRLKELDAKFEAALERLRDDFREASDTDAANAIAEYMKTREVKTPADPFVAASQKFDKEIQRVRSAARTESRANACGLLVELRKVQSRYEEQEDLDAALNIRDMLRSLLEKTSDREMSLRLSSDRPRLPVEAERLIKGFIEDTEAVERRITIEIKNDVHEFDKKLEAEVARVLATEDLEAAYSRLQQIHAFRQSYGLPGDESKPLWNRETSDVDSLKLSDESRDVVNEFRKSLNKRCEEADASEQLLRDELTAKLEQILLQENLLSKGQKSLKKTIDFLYADYTFGVRGLLLFEVDDDLPEEALTAVKQFVEKTTGLRNELVASHQSELLQMTQAQTSIRARLIEQKEYHYAFGAMASVPLLTPLFQPISVLADSDSNLRQARAAEVLDVREGEVLLRFQYQSGSEWRPRSNVFYNPGDFPAPRPEEIDLPRFAASGLPVQPNTRLRPGQEVLASTGVFWKHATIVEVSPLGIRVHWGGTTGKSSDSLVHRVQLRIPGSADGKEAMQDAGSAPPGLLGGSGGASFREVNPGNKPIAALRVTTGEWAGVGCIRRVEPFWDRTPKDDSSTVVAKENYALGAVHVEATEYVHALRFEFMRVGEDGRLNPEDSYLSDWFGTRGKAEARILTGKGRSVIGFFGRRLAVLDSVGVEFGSFPEE